MPAKKLDHRGALWKHVLQNAVHHGGTADARAVFGRAMAAEPSLRADPKAAQAALAKLVAEANALSPEQQEAELKMLAPELLARPEKPQGLPELPGAKDGAVVTRFAPAPTGALHIGHIVRAAMLSFLYAKRYHGRFLVRLEDTDAKKIKPEFYDMIREDLQSVGISLDDFILESNLMAAYYETAEKLLADGKLYVCTCAADAFAKRKLSQQACKERAHIAEENLAEWRRMLLGEYEEGAAVVRLKTSMSHKNPALRDPPLLRISNAEHPKQGARYRVWPLYNFANVVCDHLEGVTHVFRAKEHEHNTAIQNELYAALGWQPPLVINFGMVYLPGERLHKRDIREGMASGAYAGWDDIRLNTIRSFLRRGFQPLAFRELAELCGLSKTDIRLGWENIEGVNRKYLDPLAERAFVVRKPVLVAVAGAPATKQVKLPKHPHEASKGERTIPVDPSRIWLSLADIEKRAGSEIRLKGLFNIRIKSVQCTGAECSAQAAFAGTELKPLPTIQWVSEPHVRVRVVARDGEWEGSGEPALAELEPGSLIQMERIGFARVDAVEPGRVTVWFAHP